MKDMAIFGHRKKTPALDARSEFDKAIESFYHLFDRSGTPWSDDFESVRLFPSIDVVEDDTHYKVEVEMPGMDEANVKVSLDNNLLTIKGEKTVSQQDKDKNYLRREINYGCYERAIALPDYLDTEQAKATFKKGMLWVDIPKKMEFAKQKRELKIEKAG